MIQITHDTFDHEVLEADLPVMVDFFADHCGPCRALKPVLDELAEEVHGRAKIVVVDAVAEENLSREFAVDVVPTLIVFSNGEVVERLVGTQSKRLLLETLGL